MSSSDRVDFLYKQERADPEQFLLGRKIEKADHLNTYTSADAATRGVGGVEGLERQSVRTELQQQASGGTMSAEEIEAQRINIDMTAKMRDDPLFLIRKREEDDRRELLKNPLKMKRLHEMMGLVSTKKQSGISTAASSAGQKGDEGDEDGDNLLKQYLKILQQKNLEKAKSASKMLSAGKHDRHSRDKGGKKDRHRRSRSRSRSASSTSSSSSDESLLAGYMNALQQKQSLVNKMKAEEELAEKMERKAEQRKERQRLQPGGGPADEDDEEEGEKTGGGNRSPSPVATRRPKPYMKKPQQQKQEQRDTRQTSDRLGRASEESRRREEPGRRETSDYRSSSGYYRERERERDSRPRMSRSRSRSSHRDSHRGGERRRSRSPSQSPPVRHSDSRKGRKMSPATMEKRRQEMAMAAQERNVERVSNVRRYEEEDRKELVAEEELRKTHKSSFLKDTMLDHADRSSLGDRVQRNKHNVQRRGNDLFSGGEKFLKR